MTDKTTTGSDAVDLDKLEALAKAATPGPWERGDGKSNGNDLMVYGEDYAGAAIVEMRSSANFTPRERRIQNLDFIAAANPATVLSLIAQARAAAPAQAPDVCAQMRALCSACGGTGEVHRPDGEYVGECDCAAAPSLLSADELAAFNRFCECCEDFDSGGYDVEKEMMAKLARIGAVRSTGFGRYETTAYGDSIRSARAAAPAPNPDVLAEQAATMLAQRKKIQRLEAALASQPAPVLPQAAHSFLMSQDLYQFLTNAQNGIDSPATCSSANRLLVWLDKVRDALAALSQQPVQAAGDELPVIEVAYNGKDESGPFTRVIPAKSVARNPDGSYSAFIELQDAAPTATAEPAARYECRKRHENGMLLDWMPLDVDSDEEAERYMNYGEKGEWRKIAAPAPQQAAPLTDAPELIAKLERVSKWINKFPVPTEGATAMMRHIHDVQVRLLSAGSAASAGDATQAARDVLAERRRQVEAEGWTPEQDDDYADGQLSMAAACYAVQGDTPNYGAPDDWPWNKEWWKPTTDRRNLVKAAALIIADIERIDRAAMAATKEKKQ